MPGLEDIDRPADIHVTEKQIEAYYDAVAAKSRRYLELLTDEMLAEPAEGIYSRLDLILGQFRHVYGHLGNINAITIQDTGKWPRMETRPGEESELHE